MAFFQKLILDLDYDHEKRNLFRVEPGQFFEFLNETFRRCLSGAQLDTVKRTDIFPFDTFCQFDF